MPSHKEILQRRIVETERAHIATTNEVDRLSREVAAEKDAIAKAEAGYDRACRAIAEGKDEDPARFLSERDRRSHRLRGLERLLSEAIAAHQPIMAAHQQAAREMQDHLETEERARLDGEIDTAKQKLEAAQAALREAERAHNAAMWARSRFLRQQELRAKGGAQ